MRNRLSNRIDGIFSKMDRSTKSKISRSVDSDHDITSKDPTFYRDDLWRFGAFQLSNFLDINDVLMFGRGGGTKVGH